MTIKQMQFLDHLAKLFKAYDVTCFRRDGEDVIAVFKDPEEYPLKFRIYADEIFSEVETKEDYKPQE